MGIQKGAAAISTFGKMRNRVWPCNPNPVYLSKEIKSLSHRDMYTLMFIAILFIDIKR